MHTKERIQRQLNDQTLIKAFIETYEKLHEVTYTSFNWPDLSVRNRAECDCLTTGAESTPLIIELTEIETYKGKKEYDKLYLKYFQNREAEFCAKDYFTQITLPDYLLRKKNSFDWIDISNAMKSFIEEQLPDLAEGNHKIEDANGIPFWFLVSKKQSPKPQIIFASGYSREFVKENLVKKFEKALNDKARKFQHYGDQDGKKILLIESQDFISVSDSLLTASFQTALANNQSASIYDEIWLCWTWPIDDYKYQFYQLR